ncbi:substrate-binding periplasmic protein [Pseudoalteromonas luteoviolacea]|uniref:substrate-binding periplasmic protein n=1 Tax=Pseudoalteromonas luteoviolacea TaxID=43657 RepID=UPI001152F03C|nr:transporter substrate-binding domain-containing protein [Pseudoalteromonas luteoviolacea]TQF70225.1 amino acid ABC transporter substrate-binding protein [Pseudoalteromonas luteoviolacea]
MAFWCKAIITAILFVTSYCYGASKTVSVITLPDYEPFGYLAQGDTHVVKVPPGEDSELFEGFAWDVVRESFHSMGYTVELWVVPWARALTYLDSGRVDLIFPVSISAERLKIYRYSKEHVNSVFYRLYVLKSQSLEWQSLEALHDMTIAQMRGFNYGERWALLKSVDKYDVGEIIQGFEMLMSKRVEGFVGYEGVWDIVLHQHKLENDIIKLPMFDSNKEYLAASLDNPMGRKLLRQFDIGKRRITESGKLKEIQAKWSDLLSESDSSSDNKNQ